MLNRLTRYGRTLARLLKVRAQQDALVRALEDLQLKLYENPPSRTHMGAERDAIMNEVVRIQRGLARVSQALMRVEASAQQWLRDATPPDQREPALVPERPNLPQRQSPYSEDVTPAQAEAKRQALREQARLRAEAEASGPGERRVRRTPRPHSD